MLKYLLDEHIPPEYRTQLLHHEPALTVWMIGDEGAPPRGTLDPDILRWCDENGFTLVTNNRKSMPRHLADHLAEGHHLPGILTINLDAPMGAVLEQLILIVGASHEDEYLDRVVYVPLS
ncbi:DUF5615 family PIN-like protein [Candidatus Poribacteria bacterium]|nr:DUF5615 family PIN-like protein [Candidatus Poribacteria bacterium]